MKLKLIAFNPIKFTIVKELRADVDWIAALEKLTASTAQAAAERMSVLSAYWQSRCSEPAADELHRLPASLLPHRLLLEWACKGRDTPTSTLVSALSSVSARRDHTCLTDPCTNTRSTAPGTWAALVAHHRARRPSTGALSPAAMPAFTRDRSTTEPCELYNDAASRWTVQLHPIAPHSRTLLGHTPWHIQPPAGPQRENLSAQYRGLTSTCTCALPDHDDSTTLPGRARGLAGATNRRLLHEHHLDIPTSVTSTALLDQLCPQCLHDALAPPPGTDDAGRPAGDPAFVYLTWIPHEHTAPAEPDADAVLDTLTLLCDTTPSADRTVLDTMQLLGDTSLGTTRARTTRHAGSVRATADIINRYNAKVRHHNQMVEKNARNTQR